MNATDILIDAASRPLEALEGQRDALTSADLNAHPGGHDLRDRSIHRHFCRSRSDFVKRDARKAHTDASRIRIFAP